jgi:hypothetical protein
VAKFGKDPIYRTEVIVWKPVWTPIRHTQSHNTALLREYKSTNINILIVDEKKKKKKEKRQSSTAKNTNKKHINNC